jgi:translation initiation factor eIF-2B subunit epsilon
VILGENRLAFNKTFADCAGAMFKAIIDLALEAPHPTARELLSSTKDVFSRWGSLLCKFLKGSDDEVGYTVHSTSQVRTPDAL